MLFFPTSAQKRSPIVKLIEGCQPVRSLLAVSLTGLGGEAMTIKMLRHKI
jgi:hypothetical protein